MLYFTICCREPVTCTASLLILYCSLPFSQLLSLPFSYLFSSLPFSSLRFSSLLPISLHPYFCSPTLFSSLFFFSLHFQGLSYKISTLQKQCRNSSVWVKPISSYMRGRVRNKNSEIVEVLSSSVNSYCTVYLFTRCVLVLAWDEEGGRDVRCTCCSIVWHHRRKEESLISQSFLATVRRNKKMKTKTKHKGRL